ncbi:hypothetical protein BJ508DRAFT_331014 [Ascobolus immersus RN42]|uniref:Uncharacterized protein n=1 Tax=Ascobolus immersus RN42 TaxID=1160509 RepID=A0A3N4HX77_ASCIM|nr:hypothetical protein BJ508DRAFT_331014 [Ascobolus immersus RN42]
MSNHSYNPNSGQYPIQDAVYSEEEYDYADPATGYHTSLQFRCFNPAWVQLYASGYTIDAVPPMEPFDQASATYIDPGQYSQNLGFGTNSNSTTTGTASTNYGTEFNATAQQAIPTQFSPSGQQFIPPQFSPTGQQFIPTQFSPTGQQIAPPADFSFPNYGGEQPASTNVTGSYDSNYGSQVGYNQYGNPLSFGSTSNTQMPQPLAQVQYEYPGTMSAPVHTGVYINWAQQPAGYPSEQSGGVQSGLYGLPPDDLALQGPAFPGSGDQCFTEEPAQEEEVVTRVDISLPADRIRRSR